jgi:hypothetical protein
MRPIFYLPNIAALESGVKLNLNPLDIQLFLRTDSAFFVSTLLVSLFRIQYFPKLIEIGEPTLAVYTYFFHDAGQLARIVFFLAINTDDVTIQRKILPVLE